MSWRAGRLPLESEAGGPGAGEALVRGGVLGRHRGLELSQPACCFPPLPPPARPEGSTTHWSRHGGVTS